MISLKETFTIAACFLAAGSAAYAMDVVPSFQDVIINSIMGATGYFCRQFEDANSGFDHKRMDGNQRSKNDLRP